MTQFEVVRHGKKSYKLLSLDTFNIFIISTPLFYCPLSGFSFQISRAALPEQHGSALKYTKNRDS